VSSDTAEKIAFLERFKADIQAYFAGPEDQATRSRINRGMSRARELVDDAGAMKTVTLSPPAAIGGLMVRGADPFNFILQDYYGMSMVPTVADMIDQAIGVLESPDYDNARLSRKQRGRRRLPHAVLRHARQPGTARSFEKQLMAVRNFRPR